MAQVSPHLVLGSNHRPEVADHLSEAMRLAADGASDAAEAALRSAEHAAGPLQLTPDREAQVVRAIHDHAAQWAFTGDVGRYLVEPSELDGSTREWDLINTYVAEHPEVLNPRAAHAVAAIRDQRIQAADTRKEVADRLSNHAKAAYDTHDYEQALDLLDQAELADPTREVTWENRRRTVATAMRRGTEPAAGAAAPEPEPDHASPEPLDPPTGRDTNVVEASAPTLDGSDAHDTRLALHALINAAAAAWFDAQLDHSATAQQYLRSRLGDQHTLDRIRLGDGADRGGLTIGYAPADWTGLVDHLRSQGYADQDLVDAGVATSVKTGPRKGRLIDRFRNRIQFAVRDSQGRIAGFTARALAPREGEPKYLNTSNDAPLYRKGELLLGLYEQRDLVDHADAVVVEGAFDVAATMAANLLHPQRPLLTVTPCGTALTTEQLDALDAVVDPQRRHVFAPDPDAAGMRAARRLGEAALSRYPNFDITLLPGGRDPAAFALAVSAQEVVAAYQPGRYSRSALEVLTEARVSDYAEGLESEWVEAQVGAARHVAALLATLIPERGAEAADVGARMALRTGVSQHTMADLILEAAEATGSLATGPPPGRHRAPASPPADTVRPDADVVAGTHRDRGLDRWGWQLIDTDTATGVGEVELWRRDTWELAVTWTADGQVCTPVYLRTAVWVLDENFEPTRTWTPWDAGETAVGSAAQFDQLAAEYGRYGVAKPAPRPGWWWLTTAASRDEAQAEADRRAGARLVMLETGENEGWIDESGAVLPITPRMPTLTELRTRLAVIRYVLGPRRDDPILRHLVDVVVSRQDREDMTVGDAYAGLVQVDTALAKRAAVASLGTGKGGRFQPRLAQQALQQLLDGHPSLEIPVPGASAVTDDQRGPLPDPAAAAVDDVTTEKASAGPAVDPSEEPGETDYVDELLRENDLTVVSADVAAAADPAQYGWQRADVEFTELGHGEVWWRQDWALCLQWTSDGRLLDTLNLQTNTWVLNRDCLPVESVTPWEAMEAKLTTAGELRAILTEAGRHGWVEPSPQPGLWWLTATPTAEFAHGYISADAARREVYLADSGDWQFADTGETVALTAHMPRLDLRDRASVERYVLGPRHRDQQLRALVGSVLTGRARQGVAAEQAIDRLAALDQEVCQRAAVAAQAGRRGGGRSDFDAAAACAALQALLDGATPAAPSGDIPASAQLELDASPSPNTAQPAETEHAPAGHEDDSVAATAGTAQPARPDERPSPSGPTLGELLVDPRAENASSRGEFQQWLTHTMRRLPPELHDVPTGPLHLTLAVAQSVLIEGNRFTVDDFALRVAANAALPEPTALGLRQLADQVDRLFPNVDAQRAALGNVAEDMVFTDRLRAIGERIGQLGGDPVALIHARAAYLFRGVNPAAVFAARRSVLEGKAGRLPGLFGGSLPAALRERFLDSSALGVFRDAFTAHVVNEAWDAQRRGQDGVDAGQGETTAITLRALAEALRERARRDPARDDPGARALRESGAAAIAGHLEEVADYLGSAGGFVLPARPAASAVGHQRAVDRAGDPVAVNTPEDRADNGAGSEAGGRAADDEDEAVEGQPLLATDIAVVLWRMRGDEFAVFALDPDHVADATIFRGPDSTPPLRTPHEPDTGAFEHVGMRTRGIDIHLEGLERHEIVSWARLANWIEPGLTPATRRVLGEASAALDRFRAAEPGFWAIGERQMAQSAIRELEDVLDEAMWPIIDDGLAAQEAGVAGVRRRAKAGSNSGELVAAGELPGPQRAVLDRVAALATVLPNPPRRTIPAAQVPAGAVVQHPNSSDYLQLTAPPTITADDVQLTGVLFGRTSDQRGPTVWTLPAIGEGEPQLSVVPEPASLVTFMQDVRVDRASTLVVPREVDPRRHGWTLGPAQPARWADYEQWRRGETELVLQWRTVNEQRRLVAVSVDRRPHHVQTLDELRLVLIDAGQHGVARRDGEQWQVRAHPTETAATRAADRSDGLRLASLDEDDGWRFADTGQPIGQDEQTPPGSGDPAAVQPADQISLFDEANSNAAPAVSDATIPPQPPESAPSSTTTSAPVPTAGRPDDGLDDDAEQEVGFGSNLPGDADLDAAAQADMIAQRYADLANEDTAPEPDRADAHSASDPTGAPTADMPPAPVQTQQPAAPSPAVREPVDHVRPPQGAAPSDAAARQPPGGDTSRTVAALPGGWTAPASGVLRLVGDLTGDGADHPDTAGLRDDRAADVLATGTSLPTRGPCSRTRTSHESGPNWWPGPPSWAAPCAPATRARRESTATTRTTR